MELAEIKKRIPQELLGYDIDWSGYEPQGGWDFADCIGDGLVAEFEKRAADLKRRCEEFDSAMGNVTEAVRQSKDIGERIDRFAEFAQTAVLPNGDKLTKCLTELQQTLVDEDERVVDYPRTIRSALMLFGVAAKLGETCRRELDRQEKFRAETVASYSRVKALVDFHRAYFNDQAYQYAIEKVAVKYRTKILRDAIRNGAAGVDAFAVMENCASTDPKMAIVFNDERGGKVTKRLGADLRESVKCMRIIRKDVEKRGNIVWEEADKHHRRKLAEAKSYLDAKPRSAEGGAK